jgi:transcriptional regulator with XRE-family HTH domain
MISDLFGKRQSRPGFEMLYKIGIAYPRVRMDWLINGIGPSLRDANEHSENPVNEAFYNEDGKQSTEDEHKAYLLESIVRRDIVNASQVRLEIQELANNLSAVRTIRGFSKAAVAQKLEITEDELTKIELGDIDPSGDVVSALTTLYRVPIEYLFKGLDREHILLKALEQYERQSPARLRADIDEILVRLDRAGI